MKSFLKFILIFSCILLLSAALAPVLYKLMPFKFEKVFNRLVMIFSLLAVLFFVRFRRESFQSFGLAWERDSLAMAMKAFATGLFILVLLSATSIALGNAHWHPTKGWGWHWLWRIPKFLNAGILIGIIEEFFFRGFIFRSFKEKFSWPLFPSLIVTNVFYALIHFVSDYSPFIGPDPTFQDSFKLMAAPFQSLANWRGIGPHAFGLFLFGLVLNDQVLRTRSLYPAIGLHAACVFFIKLDGFFVDYTSHGLLFGTNTLIDGALGWSFLILLGIVLRLVIKAPVPHQPVRT